MDNLTKATRKGGFFSLMVVYNNYVLPLIVMQHNFAIFSNFGVIVKKRPEKAFKKL